MLKKLNEKEFKKELGLKIVLISFAILFYFFMKNISFGVEKTKLFFGTMSPFIYGMVIAYLMFRPVCFIENQLFKLFHKKEKYRQVCRNIAIFIMFFMILAIFVFIGNVFIPQLVESLTVLTEKVPTFVDYFEMTWQKFMKNTNLIEELKRLGFTNVTKYKADFWTNLNEKTIVFFKTVIPGLIAVSGTFTSKIVSIFMGIIVSIYLLSGKETFQAQSKKMLYAILPNHVVEEILRIVCLSNDTFQNYIGGQVLDAVILGVITFVCMIVLRIPMAFMISFLVTICNVIPMFGSILSGIIGIFLILVIDPSKAILFAILIIVLQQIDGNILLPKIVGDSTGLSGFWVFLAIFLGGVIGGLPAIVIAVPVMSVVYTLMKERIEGKLMKKNMPIETRYYLDK